MTQYADGGRFEPFYRPGPAPVGGAPIAYLPPGLSPAEKKPGMLSPAPMVNPDLSPGYQASAPAPAATAAPVSPAPAPQLPAGFNPITNQSGYETLYREQFLPGRPAQGRGGVATPAQYATANQNGLMANGFVNATDFVKGKIGGADIVPVYYNPTTGKWASSQGRGLYVVADQPRVVGIDNSSDWTDNFRELAGAAMTGWTPALTAAGLTGVDFLGAGGMLSDAAKATGIPASVLGPAATFGTNLALTGDPKAALKGTAIGAGIGAVASNVAPALNELLASMGLDASKIPPEDLKILTADASGGVPLYSIPAATEFDAAGNPVSSTPAMTYGSGMLTGGVPTSTIDLAPINAAGALIGSPDLKNLDQQDKEALMKQDQGISPKDIERIAKLTQSLAKLGKTGAPQGAPQRAEGQSNEQYATQLAQYANLNPAEMAAMGLQPGSPEYMQYVMDQMDSIISQLTDGMDMNAADITEQLHAKTGAELEQLQRALYVRGQMSTLVGPGQYTDPFTGIGEDVMSPNGEQFNPATAAYQRGLARTAGEIGQGGASGTAALKGMLGRNVDLYSLQARQDARRLEAMLNPQGQETKRRGRGLLGKSYEEMLNTATQPELEQLVHAFGGDTERAKAALSSLLGMG